MKSNIEMRQITNLNTGKRRVEVKIEKHFYKILSVETPEDYFGKRPNLLEFAKANKVQAILKVQRPKGKKVYAAYKFENGKITFA